MRDKRNTVQESNQSDNLPSLITETTYIDADRLNRPPSSSSTINHHLNHIKNLGDEISAGSPKFAMNYMKPASSSRNIPTSSKTDQ